MTKFSTRLAVTAILLSPGWALAEVADSSTTGFAVKTSVTIQASPAEVYRRLVHNVADWWNPQHTFSGDARNLSIEEKPMGCFCETLPDRGAVRHMEVLRFAPGKTLVLSGALGPMQSLAAAATMTIQLSPGDAGTKVEVTYSVAGYLAEGMNTWAAPADFVVTEQFTRLKNYVEHGSPAVPLQTPPAPASETPAK